MSMYPTSVDLYADVQAHMNRNEASIVQRIPLWVGMAEDELDRRLRHPAAQVVAQYTVIKGASTITAPENLLELKSIRLVDTKATLFRRSSETLYAQPGQDDKFPTCFSSEGNRYVLNKEAFQDMDMEFIFWVAPNHLNLTDTTSNLYLVAAGDILLYLALSYGFAYDANPQESAYFRQLAEQQLANLQSQIDRESIAGSTLVTFQNTDFLSTYF